MTALQPAQGRPPAAHLPIAFAGALIAAGAVYLAHAVGWRQVALFATGAGFGIGMQIGGGRASGTLYAAGGGSTRMVATLAGFVAGATIAAAHQPWWLALPSLGTVSLGEAIGIWPAIALQLAIPAAIWGAVLRHRVGQPARLAVADRGAGRKRAGDTDHAGDRQRLGWRIDAEIG